MISSCVMLNISPNGMHQFTKHDFRKTKKGLFIKYLNNAYLNINIKLDLYTGICDWILHHQTKSVDQIYFETNLVLVNVVIYLG